jgi:5-methylcytosine-specific restriction protein A
MWLNSLCCAIAVFEVIARRWLDDVDNLWNPVAERLRGFFMAKSAPKPCNAPRCKKLVHFSSRFCEEHQKLAYKLQDERRGNSYQRGYTGKWAKARAQHLHAHPLCVHCFSKNLITPATELDHIVPHKGNMSLFWDVSNWQGLCKKCHSTKTAKEDGGFGRKIFKKDAE